LLLRVGKLVFRRTTPTTAPRGADVPVEQLAEKVLV
jgi:hypothetical protein